MGCPPHANPGILYSSPQRNPPLQFFWSAWLWLLRRWHVHLCSLHETLQHLEHGSFLRRFESHTCLTFTLQLSLHCFHWKKSSSKRASILSGMFLVAWYLYTYTATLESSNKEQYIGPNHPDHSDHSDHKYCSKLWCQGSFALLRCFNNSPHLTYRVHNSDRPHLKATCKNEER